MVAVHAGVPVCAATASTAALIPQTSAAIPIGTVTETGKAIASPCTFTLTKPDCRLLLAPPPDPVIALAIAVLRPFEVLVAVQAAVPDWAATASTAALIPQTLAATPIGTATETGTARAIDCRLTLTRPFW